MSDHTAGPWIEFSDQRGTTAILPMLQTGEVCAFKPPLPSRVNSRLISAAPDLLEALQNSVVIINRHVPESALGYRSISAGDPNCAQAWPIKDDYVRTMIAAIAKATGQSE